MRWGWRLGAGIAVLVALIITLAVGAVVSAEIEQQAVRTQLGDVKASCGPVAAAITAETGVPDRVAALAPAIRPPALRRSRRRCGMRSGNWPASRAGCRVAFAKLAGPVCAALGSWAPVPSASLKQELGGATR